MKIILATDGSDSALAAVDFLASFPFPEETEVAMLSVIDRSLLSGTGREGMEAEHQEALSLAEESLKREAEELLRAESARLEQAGWPSTAEVRFGSPAAEIVKAAEDSNADLILLGSRGTSDLKHLLMGGVSHNVLHYAPCSVLLVRHPSHIPLEAPWHVLIAYDDSEPAKRAMELCASLPLAVSDEVTTLTVLPLVTMFRQDIRQRLSPFWHQKKQAALAALRAATDAVQWSTSEVAAELREGPNVSQEILNAAERLESDLIMLGDKGAGAFEKLLLGSVTNRTARHAGCAVWVVRAKN